MGIFLIGVIGWISRKDALPFEIFSLVYIQYAACQQNLWHTRYKVCAEVRGSEG